MISDPGAGSSSVPGAGLVEMCKNVCSLRIVFFMHTFFSFLIATLGRVCVTLEAFTKFEGFEKTCLELQPILKVIVSARSGRLLKIYRNPSKIHLHSTLVMANSQASRS